MKKEQMVGTRLPRELVRDLEKIESTEQSDRSTTVRKLLYKAIAEWKLEHYARLCGEGKLTLSPCCPRGRRIHWGDDGLRTAEEDTGAVRSGRL